MRSGQAGQASTRSSAAALASRPEEIVAPEPGRQGEIEGELIHQRSRRKDRGMTGATISVSPV